MNIHVQFGFNHICSFWEEGIWTFSCDGGHLGFPIGIKNRNLVKDIPIIIHLQFGFSQFISFREEDLWNFSQSEHIIDPGSHVEYPTRTKNSNFVEDHPRNILAKFGCNWPSGFGEKALKCEKFTDDRQHTTDNRRQTTDDRRKVMAIVHMDLWSRWTKKHFNIFLNHQNKYDWLASSYLSKRFHGNISHSVNLQFLFFVWLKNDLLNVMLQIEEIISNVIENTNRSIKLNQTITYM